MKLTLEVYSTSAGDTGGVPSFGVRIRDRRALEAGALYDPLDVNFLVDKEFLPAPETVAVSIYRPSEDGEDALVATTAGSAFAPVPGHSMMRRGALATATQGFDSWYEETRCPDGDHTYPVPVFSILEVRWSCGADDCMARAGAVPAILTPIGVRAAKGLDGEDGEDGKAPEVDVADLGDGTYRMTVTSPDGTVQTVEWRDGRDGDGASFPVPVSPADATKDDQYADALAVKGLLDSLRKDLSGVEARLDTLDSLAGVELLESISESLAAKVDKVDGSGLVPVGHISVLADFIDRHGNFGKLASLDEVPFECLAASFTKRFEALEAAVESLSSSGGETLTTDYVKFLDAVVASGDDPAQRILDAVDLVLAESNDAGKGIWKAVNANAKGLAELEAKVGTGGSSSIPAELEAMIRNSVQKDAFGRGFSSNDFTQDYIDRINNSVQKEAGKGLSTVDFTMERAERLDALYNSSSTLNPPVKPDENAKEGQPADAKDTYEALKGKASPTTASDSYGGPWGGFTVDISQGHFASEYYRCTFTEDPTVTWDGSSSIWDITGIKFRIEETGGHYPAQGRLATGDYSYLGSVATSLDRNATSIGNDFRLGIPSLDDPDVTFDVSFDISCSRELYIRQGDSYVTKTYVDNRITDEIGKIEIPEPDGGVTLPSDLDCATLLAANSVTVGFRSSADIPGQASFSSGRGNVASGDHSHAEGDSVIAKGLNSHAEGCTTKAEGNCSHAEGKYTEASGAYSHAAGFRAKAQQRAYAWSGVESDTVYESNGDGTYNINPANGIEGFYVGDKNLKTILSEEAPVPDLSGYVKKTASGGISLRLQYNDDMENSPLFLDIEGAVRMGQPSRAGDEALLEMQAGGRPGGFKVLVTPSYDESAGEEVSSTTVSIDGIKDVAGELRKIPAKRDSTDNIAAKDEVRFTEWKFHCDVPEIQAALDANPPVLSHDPNIGPLGGQWLANDGPEISGFEGPSGWADGAVTAESIIIYDMYLDLNTGQSISPVTATRKKVTTTKSGEPYVTPTGVKALAPKTELHALAPETYEGKVTLKPVDGAANHGTGKIVLGPSGLPLRELRINVMLSAEYDNPDPDGAPVITYHGSASFRDFSVDTWDVSTDEFVQPTRIGITVTDDVNFSGDDGNIARIPKGTQMAFLALEAFQEDESFADLGMYIEHGEDGIQAIVPGVLETSTEAYFSQHIPEPKSVTVHVPASTDPTKARRFSLAVETDVDSEKAVEWQGGEVIEAFPGASKLAVGTTVWDVKEVAPGKMLVNRAPGASGGAVTVTGDNGTVYTLGVDNEGTLEVRS